MANDVEAAGKLPPNAVAEAALDSAEDRAEVGRRGGEVRNELDEVGDVMLLCQWVHKGGTRTVAT